MKKILGISLVAVLSALPLMASAADVAPSPVAVAKSGLEKTGANVITATNGKYYAGETITDNDKAAAASAAYVKGAYNAAISAVNKVAETADSAVKSVAEGSANGTIKVDNVDVSVHGLGSAAYTDSTAYATAAQGAKADSAVQSVAEGATNGTIAVDGTDVAVHGLGSAAYTASTAYEAAGTTSTAIAGLDASVSQTAGADGLALTVTEVDGVITSVTGSIASGTYATAAQGTKADNAADKDLSNISATGKSNVSAQGTVDLTKNDYGTGTVGKALVDIKTTADGAVQSANLADKSLSIDAASVKVNGTDVLTSHQSIAEGATNGTIAVAGTDVAVHGLGSAAYTASTDYATAAQGTKADTALQAASITTGATAGTIAVNGTDVAVNGVITSLAGYATETGVAATVNAATGSVNGVSLGVAGGVTGMVPVMVNWGDSNVNTTNVALANGAIASGATATGNITGIDVSVTGYTAGGNQ